MNASRLRRLSGILLMLVVILLAAVLPGAALAKEKLDYATLPPTLQAALKGQLIAPQNVMGYVNLMLALGDEEGKRVIHKLEGASDRDARALANQELSDATMRYVFALDLSQVTDATPEQLAAVLARMPNLQWLKWEKYPYPQVEFLTQLPSLATLWLTQATLLDWSALSDCKALRHLSLSQCGLSDLRALPALRRLTMLMLDENQLTSLAGIENFPALEELDVSRNPLASLEGLAGLKKLKTLRLNAAQGGSGLTATSLESASLQTLFLHEQGVATRTLTLTLPKLKECYATHCDLANLSTLAGCLPQLTALSIGDESLTDVGALAQARKLTALTIRDMPLADVAFVSSMPKLTELTLMNCGLNNQTDLSPILALGKLEKLRLPDNQISVFGLMRELPYGLYIDLGGNPCLLSTLTYPNEAVKQAVADACAYEASKDSAPLTSQSLYLHDLDLGDMAFLESFVNLQSLTLYNCTFSDLSVLYRMPKLTELSVAGQGSLNLAQLPNLGTMVRLEVSGLQLEGGVAALEGNTALAHQFPEATLQDNTALATGT